MTETWLPVVGYEGRYEVSDCGRVRSLDHVTVDTLGRSRPYKGKMLTPYVGEPAYPGVNLVRGPSRRFSRIHVLVMAAFVGPPPLGMEVRHLNGNSLDCRLENLSYGTRSENIHDGLRHGTHHWARRTHCKWGHEYTPENISWRSNRGSVHFRACKACDRIRSVRRRRLQRAS